MKLYIVVDDCNDSIVGYGDTIEDALDDAYEDEYDKDRSFKVYRSEGTWRRTVEYTKESE